MDARRLTFILALVAAALAWSAAGIRYYRSGDVDWMPLAAGLFMLALAISARSRSGSRGGA
jgi:hypothetical protein